MLLPQSPDMGWRWRAAAVCKLLQGSEGGRASEAAVTLAVGLPQSADYDWLTAAKDIRQDAEHVIVRPLTWSPVEVDQARRVYANLQIIDGISTYWVPQDGGWNFADCDVWLLCADVGLGAVIPLRPTTVYCRGLENRYVAGVFGDIHTDPAWDRQLDSFVSWRRAGTVIAVEPETVQDLVSYAGVRRSAISQVQSLWPYRITSPKKFNRKLDPYILWLTEPNALHGGMQVVKLLEKYVEFGGRLPIVIAGERIFDYDFARGGRHDVARFLASRPDLLATLSFVQINSEAEVDDLVKGARAVWSSRLADGEPDAPRLASDAGKPFIGFDFPQMRSAAGIAASFCSLEDVDDLVRILLDIDNVDEANNCRAESPKPLDEIYTSFQTIFEGLLVNVE